MSVYREIAKHFGIYGFGLALSRVASLLLLPLYTSFLTPADYGVIAILDVTATILSHLAAGGVYAAVLRYHFDPRYAERRHALWTTGLAMLGMISLPQLVLAWVLRSRIAALAFGADLDAGPQYLALAILAMPGGLVAAFGQAYVRAQKRSTLFIAITVPILVLRILLNVYFIAFRGMGVFGFLYSGLLATSLEGALLFGVLFLRRPLVVIRSAMGPLWSYGWPLIVTSLAGLVMHEADRYLLRWFLDDLGPIGIYAVAYALAQGVNSLILIPFDSIWSTVMFEVNADRDRVAVFRRVFRFFVFGTALVLLGVALASVPIVRIITAPEYAEAAQVLPWLCLAFLFFPLHAFYRVPAMIHGRTERVARTSLVAAATNLGANLLLIPRYGIYGAAMASVLTYAAYAFFGQWTYRKVEDLRFPAHPVVLAVAGGIGLVCLERALVPADAPFGIQVAVAAGLWAIAAGLVLGGPGRGLLRRESGLRHWMAEFARR